MTRLVLSIAFFAACQSSPAISPDAAVPPAHCDPVGTWRIHYQQPGQAGDTGERVLVESRAGAFAVSFPDRPVPVNACGASTPGQLTFDGSVSADGCTLMASRRESYCFSGEGQCQHLAVTLTLAADGKSARGSGTWCRCWDPDPSCHDRPIAVVTATRESP